MADSSRVHPALHMGLIWGQEEKQPRADVLDAHVGWAGDRHGQCACIEGFHRD